MRQSNALFYILARHLEPMREHVEVDGGLLEYASYVFRPLTRTGISIVGKFPQFFG